MMKTREEAAQRAHELLAYHNGEGWHFGIVAIRQLLDFVYEGPATTPDQCVTKNKVSALYNQTIECEACGQIICAGRQLQHMRSAGHLIAVYDRNERAARNDADRTT